MLGIGIRQEDRGEDFEDELITQQTAAQLHSGSGVHHGAATVSGERRWRNSEGPSLDAHLREVGWLEGELDKERIGNDHTGKQIASLPPVLL